MTPLLSGGAAIQNLLLALSAQGLASSLDRLPDLLPPRRPRRARRGPGMAAPRRRRRAGRRPPILDPRARHRSIPATSPTGGEVVRRASARLADRWVPSSLRGGPRQPRRETHSDVSNRPNDARRPTKAERKEQARLEREAIQRQMAARKRNRTIGLSLVALAAVAAIVAVVVLQPSSGSDAALPAPADLLDAGRRPSPDGRVRRGHDDRLLRRVRPDLPRLRRPGAHRGRRAVPRASAARHVPEHAAGLRAARRRLDAAGRRVPIAARPGTAAALARARGHRRLVRPRRAARMPCSRSSTSTIRTTRSARTA